ncbi:MAG: pyridoxine 5'-phosphate synthase [Nitrospiraceae bacterium]|nr:pyridoxine 5'-phosphate synthase [Nitrospiraceae bacterium]
MPALISSHYSERLSLIRFGRVAEILLRAIGRPEAELSILLVGDAEITHINEVWLKRPYPTNVISFGQENNYLSQSGFDLLGDIVISVDTARRESVEAGMSLDQRLDALLVHGLLHLLGEDHELGPAEAAHMAAREQELLNILYREKVMADLYINLDHVATIREAAGSTEPDPVIVAGIVEVAGADGIVVHLWGDRRNIQDRDVRLLRQTVKTRIILEVAATDEMLEMASEIRPDMVTLLSETGNRSKIEKRLDVVDDEDHLTEAVKRLNDAGIAVGLSVDPEQTQIEAARRTGCSYIELYSGRYADSHSIDDREFENIVSMARLARELGLQARAGHGLDYYNIAKIAAVSDIDGFSIGHAVIARAILVGIATAVKEMLSLVKKGYIE